MRYILLSILLACTPSSPGPSGYCCKTCGSASKACGDSCIANDKQCNKPAGCACEANALDIPATPTTGP